ncbi:hypothetical protein V6D99_03115 [Providencia stuartii]|uniref:hypothetical protein n=1 Tax=Providencia stuartii TaxID=588 RepID=UPI002FDA3A07
MPKDTTVIEVQFDRYDIQQICGDDIIRIIASNKVLYCYSSQFPQILPKLDSIKKNEKLKVCVSQLDSGDYWLYWLIAENGCELTTDYERGEGDFVFIFNFFVLIIMAILIMIIKADIFLSGIAFILMAIVYIGLIYGVKGLWIMLCSPFNSAILNLQKEKGQSETGIFNKKAYFYMFFLLRKIINKLSFTEHYYIESNPDININRIKKLGLHVSHFEVEEKETTNKNVHISNYVADKRVEIDVSNNYHYIHSKGNIYYCGTHERRKENSIFMRSQAPFIVAKGDDVEIIHDEKKAVIGLINNTSQSAYLFTSIYFCSSKDIA